ncbi:DsbA family oxidoreductase [Ottowia testudinis]|uniref:DsbA family oxidoreductase n=1 Tax=Ottowia testudinis TaxID=2816950 RepID=A0A975H3V7_9BURK|nr:DsbA family oxidoreductase [Ottowia testudinis]QTD46278.1 DsbA family oxidoreductase [Ottowia testudinis]
MPTPLKIDFVSDIACPWCAVGLASLQKALADSADVVQATLHFQPFELNPDMPPGGEDVNEHLARKYGGTPEQFEQNRAAIRAHGAAVGFAFHPAGRGRIYNTFNAHRLLHWAGLQGEGPQLALKRALLDAYHGRGEAVEQPEVLLAAVAQAGLDVARARQILAGGEFAAEVRQAEAFWRQAGISSVPAVIINGRHLISGGQPPEVFEQALRQLAAPAA